jgi:[protein-PII] uridylyltransferase
VQYDAYHKFPAGRHSLETLRNIKDLPIQKDLLLLDIFSDLPSHESLFLAALFHDIGKNGNNHSVKGAKIATDILNRLNIEDSFIKDVKFLIENHLLLAETAARRDLNDEKIVVQCARRVGTVERLKMLYLLTWADSKATGPKAWNDWISNLVQELFFKIMHIFKNEELATPQASEKVSRTKSNVRRHMRKQIEKDELERTFDIMSPRYILNTSPFKIAEHLLLFKRYKEMQKENAHSTFVFSASEDEMKDCWEISILAKDRPGIFSDLAGVFALNNISIFSAEVYTWRDGTAVDIFKVTKPLDAVDPERTWKKVKDDLDRTFTGKLYLEYRLEKKAAPSIISKTSPPSHPARIVFDNESSDFFTLIEVFADDRVGLLYIITRCLFELRIDIRIAKIATKGDQIADIFYVRDLLGQKLEDPDQLNEIEKALLHQLKTFGRPRKEISV